MNKEAKVLAGITIATILVLVGGAFLFNKKDNAPAPEAKVFDQSLLVGNSSPSKGPEDAKVQIVEFGDFQCPACGVSYPIVKQVIAKYGDKVRFVFRHFPLEQHKNAFNAARASEAAKAQGKFWEMHDKLYDTQEAWGETDDAVTRFEGFAKDLGLNVDDYKKAVSDKSFDNIIQSGLTDGTAAGVNSTPTFFVNGKKLPGVMSLDQWERIIDPYLQ